MRIASALLLFLLLQTTAFGRPNAFLSYAVFDQPGAQSYLETYLYVDGTTVMPGPISAGKRKATLEVTWIFHRNDSIVGFDKYLLYSPEVDSEETASVDDFIDVQRTPLAEGTYTLELLVGDKNSTDPPVRVEQTVNIHFPEDSVSFSDIELLESYRPTKSPGPRSKSGYDLVPYALGYFPEEATRLLFYTEIYRTQPLAAEEVLVRYMISNNETHQLVQELVGSQKRTSAPVIPLMAELPIAALPSGNYLLSVEVRNRDNRLLAYRQCFFQRINSITAPVREIDLSLVDASNTFAWQYTNVDTLAEFIESMFPILSPLEGQIAENQLHNRQLSSLQQLMYYYWSRKSPDDPQAGWLAYRLEVAKVNAAYSTYGRKGYETDRGRVYLAYGPPNTITKEVQDPEAYPFEIWHYYKINNQTNRRFVFYSTDLASNEFRLLHSDVKGEVQDPNWELKLHSRSQAFGPDLDQSQSYDIYGSRTKEDFRLPR